MQREIKGIGPMMHTVEVWGKKYEVSVHQLKKTVWEAVATYTEVLAVPGDMSREIRVKGRTESAALNLWRETARYWGN